MGKLLILATLLASPLLIRSEDDPLAGMKPLYESSDPNLPWPPEGKNFDSEDKNTWPGQGERLGASWPRIKVPEIEENPSAKEFFAEYVFKRKPVVMNKLWKQMMKVSGYDMSSKSLVNDSR